MNPAELVPALALLAVLTREWLWITAVAIMVSSLDDLAVDFLWIGGRLFRRPSPLPPPGRTGAYAIFVPAWDEAAVIRPMLTRLLATLDHPDYTVFVGLYPNDPDTVSAVAEVNDPRVVPVFNSRYGPTTKADCLNAIWRGMRDHEQQRAMQFDAVVLHDAEDVVHPYELRLFDHYMPALAMVQLPVLPLPDPRSRWISGHYLDDFAQNHAKDMLVRAWLDTPVPSAGVGTAIDRTALARIAGSDPGPFDAASLTEDYEIGQKLYRMGLKGRLIRHRIDGELVATREYFPDTLEAAVRQKSRWLTGIALTGWDRLGWEGNRATRWMLLRDRKGLLGAAIGIVAWALALLTIGQLAVRWLAAETAGVTMPPLLGGVDHAWLRILLWFNFALLGWRLLATVFFTGREYGPAEALRSIPRLAVANVINALAAARAIGRYREALLAGILVDWDKTHHRFPEADMVTRT